MRKESKRMKSLWITLTLPFLGLNGCWMFGGPTNAQGSPAPAPTVVVSPIPTITTTVQPGPSNTGVPKGITLKPSGSVTAKSGQVIEGLAVKGSIKLGGTTNVTIRNCTIDGGGASYGIRADGGAKGAIVDHVEISNASSAGVFGDQVTVQYSNVHHIGGDGFKLNNGSVLKNNWVHHLGYNSPGAHADGIQIRGSHDIKILDNFFDMPINLANTHSNSAVFLQGNNGVPSNNITINHNWLNGGNYALHLYTDGGNPKTVFATNNILYVGSTRYGMCSVQSGVVVSGNVAFGTGKPVVCSTK